MAYRLLGSGCTIHMLDGRLVAEVARKAVFGVDGCHMGWFVDRQMYDPAGMRVLARADNDDIRDIRHMQLAVGWTEHRYARSTSARQTIPPMPPLDDRWAAVSGQAFLDFNIASDGTSGVRALNPHLQED